LTSFEVGLQHDHYGVCGQLGRPKDYLFTLNRGTVLPVDPLYVLDVSDIDQKTGVADALFSAEDEVDVDFLFVDAANRDGILGGVDFDSQHHEGEVDLFGFVGRVHELLMEEGTVYEGRMLELNSGRGSVDDLDGVLLVVNGAVLLAVGGNWPLFLHRSIFAYFLVDAGTHPLRYQFIY
jgi:hypothetical protein